MNAHSHNDIYEIIFQILTELSVETRQYIENADERDGKYYPVPIHLGFFLKRDTMYGPEYLNEYGIIARDIILNRKKDLLEASRDLILEDLNGMQPYLGPDQSDPKRFGNYHRLAISYLMLKSSDDAQIRMRAEEMAIGWLEEGRRRWKGGFWANPLGQPVRRSA